jgi:hypothetical protein
VLKKKIWANFQRIMELFTQKIVTKLSKVWVWDPGSGKNLFRIPDPGVKKAPDPGSGSVTLIFPKHSTYLFIYFRVLPDSCSKMGTGVICMTKEIETFLKCDYDAQRYIYRLRQSFLPNFVMFFILKLDKILNYVLGAFKNLNPHLYSELTANNSRLIGIIYLPKIFYFCRYPDTDIFGKMIHPHLVLMCLLCFVSQRPGRLDVGD